MPVQRCQRDGEQGWQYGDSGKCYLASEEGSDDEAKRKAYLQGAAIEGSGYKEEAQHMATLDVPILKPGVFNGLAIKDIPGLVSDTLKAMPYLLEAQQTGQYRGEKNARFNTEPVPPFIHLRHFPTDIAGSKLHDWAAGVTMTPETRLFNAEEWSFVRFDHVDPDLAKLLAEGFPYRSAELLPNFENPDTGEVYPVVLRSVAFLGANTDPAVPQEPGYSVKLSRDEMGIQTVRCDVPDIINHETKETDIMADAQEASTVKLSREEFQEFAAMKGRLEALEQVQKENTTLKGVVDEMKGQNDALSSEVLKLQQENKATKTEATLLKLENEYHLTPAALEAIRPVVVAENGVVKFSEDADPVPTDQAYLTSLEHILKLAKDKDALFVPESSDLPTGKHTEPTLTEYERQEAEIKKFQAEAKAQGKDMDYWQARAQWASKSNDILDKITKLRNAEGGE